MQNTRKKTLVIITGSNGKLGKAYFEKFENKGYSMLTIGRTGNPDFKVDLLNKKRVLEKLQKYDFSIYKKVIFIHPVGKFKFEKEDGVLDIELFKSNVETFTCIFDYLLNLDVEIVVVCFGSISDKYNVPFWRSYTYAKNFLRKLLKYNKYHNVKSLFVNVSTVDTGNENKLRPHGKKKYWLSVGEVVEETFTKITKISEKFEEVDVFKYNPEFDPSYYSNKNAILQKWKDEMKS